MSHLAALLLSIIGFAALALVNERQQHELFDRALPARQTRLLGTFATLALLAVLAGLVSRWGWSLGLVMFSGHTSLAAGIILIALIIRERRRV